MTHIVSFVEQFETEFALAVLNFANAVEHGKDLTCVCVHYSSLFLHLIKHIKHFFGSQILH